MTLQTQARRRKQTLTHEDFLAIRAGAAMLVPRHTYRLMLTAALEEIARVEIDPATLYRRDR